MTQFLTKPLALLTGRLARSVSRASFTARVADDLHGVVAPASAPTGGRHGFVTAGLQTLAGGTRPAPGFALGVVAALEGPFFGAGEVVDMVTVFARPHLGLDLDCVCADWAFISRKKETLSIVDVNRTELRTLLCRDRRRGARRVLLVFGLEDDVPPG